MLDRPASATEFSIDMRQSLPAEWPGVADMEGRDGHIFQTREFLGVWAATFGADLGLDARFVTVRDKAGALILELPLAIERRGRLRVMSFADHSCADINAPILGSTATTWTAERAQALWAAIEAALPPVDLVVLEKMPALVGGRVNPLCLLANEDNPESIHGSNLTRPWADIEATQAQLKTLKRKARGLEKLGGVRFVVAADAPERQRILSRLLAQKQRRFEETRVPGFGENPTPRHFFEQATEVFARSGNLHLAALEVGGELIATSWTVSLGKRIYELMIGFEAGEWEKHSGGRVLNLRYLEWAKAQGFAYLDHGIGDEAWKHENCDTHVPLKRLVAARTGRGRRALTRLALVAWLRRTALYQRLRPLKWVVKRALRRG